MKRFNQSLSIALIIAFFATLAVHGSTDSANQEPPLSTTDIVVQYRDPARVSVKGFGERRTVTFRYSDGYEAAQALRELRTDPNVAFAEPNITRYLSWVPENEEYYEEQQSWVDQIDLATAWNITTGRTEIVVAVIDSGVSPTQPDLVDRLVPGYNAVDATDNWADTDGHGTHIAGIIAADGRNNIGTAGAAMDVKIMPINVVSPSGAIRIDSIVTAIDWAIANNADVINLSLGSNEPSEIERSAIQRAYQAGIPVLSSAGNAASKISYPASYPEVISVGSLDETGNRSVFSSVVSRVDIAAPGEHIFSPGWDAESGDNWSDQIAESIPVSGTSFATAITTGCVALIRSVNYDLDIEEIRDALTSTATDSGEPGAEAGVGAGQLNAEAALRAVAFMAMHETWYPADYPIVTGHVSRTWLWGTEPPQYWAYEPYDEAQNNVRLVYYYDKSRMEITDPHADHLQTWYVTNGLLVVEMITGKLQVGDDVFEAREPAAINIAGDPDDALGPTYATFSSLLDVDPLPDNAPVTQTISRSGDIGDDSRFLQFSVTAAQFQPTTGHQIASVFWDYLNSDGPIALGDEFIDGPLFDPWFYATGLPITEAYWAQVKVANIVQDVLIQCFERRCLTYTPANPDGWQVEMGNVGMHYHTWRYDISPQPPDTGIPEETGILYQTDFSDWPNQTFEEGTTFFAVDGYHIRVTEPDVFIPQLVEGRDFGDVSISVTIQSIGGISFSQGCLMARVTADLAANYAFCIDAGGQVTAVYEGFDSETGPFAETLLELQPIVGPEVVAAGVNLKLIVRGQDFWFLVNDSLVGQASHSKIESGSVGIYVLNKSGATAEFKFTNLVVYSIE